MLPNFLIIGAAKSGTTAIYTYIKQHPEIFMSPKKELRYFSNFGKQSTNVPKQYVHEAVSTLKEYETFFNEIKDEKVFGESSPTYLYTLGTAERIKALIPDVKLLAILRNPVDRAYSAYTHALREWKEPANSFQEALELEPARIAAGWGMLWHYKHAGLYYQQLKRYYQIFDENQIKVVLYDDLVTNPRDLLQEIFIFLGVNSSFIPDISTRPNVSGFPKNELFDKILRYFFIEDNIIKNFSRIILPQPLRKKITTKMREANLKKWPMPLDLREQLHNFFQEDIISLAKLINNDLSMWLS